MPVESAADRAAFLDPDEFGERVLFRPAGSEVIDAVALWLRAGDKANFGDTVQLNTERFIVERGVWSSAAVGDIVEVFATGEQYTVLQPPVPLGDGAFETILAVPA